MDEPNLMKLLIPVLFLTGFLSSLVFSQAPDRESFAESAGPAEFVPVEAFDLAAEDLKIEVWAQSPLIFSPVAMDVDAKGRVWATEGIDYNQGRRVATGQSIIVVEDSDRDGKADRSHVFVSETGLRHAPLGIAVFDNRIVLSATPSIIVYTDVDRNALFDPEIDKREVFLTGFKNDRHDHTLHAVVGAPSGQWHFSFGNCGADVQTKDGRHFLSGCYYGFPEAIGKASSDGHVYVGGVTMRINPDGTGLAATGHNMRNPHDMAVSAFGDVFQSDNDDPAHCRSSWVMEYGNMGYADLRDGSRSWEEVAKTWEEPEGWDKSLRYSRSHWRENYPGACPPGSVYGAGSPTGNALIEDDTLGLAGSYLNCCMVRKEVMMTRPKLEGSHYDLGEHEPFLSLKVGEKGRHFLPTDVVVAPDGSLLLSDFYNDTSRRTNQVSGTIYRISRKGSKTEASPEVDFETVPGLLAALESPAVNIRSHAAWLLVGKGEPVTEPVKNWMSRRESDPKAIARGIWILAQLGESGVADVENFLKDEDERLVVTAYRALRLGDPDGMLNRAALLASATSAAVRREVALSLRDVSFSDCRHILNTLIAGYEASDRYALEALGIAFTGKEEEVYRELVTALFGEATDWGTKAKDLAWRLHTSKAIADLDTCIRSQKPELEEFRHLAMAFASFRTPEDRADRKARLEKIGDLPWTAVEGYQVTIDEIIAKDLNELQGRYVDFSSVIPESFGGDPDATLSEAAVIAKLPGDREQGALQSARCVMCHRIGGSGVAFGPDLTHWGGQRTVEEIIQEIVDPDAKLAHGYGKPVRLKKGQHVIEGLLSNYSWHAGSLKVKLMGGETRKILFRRSGAQVEFPKESWMPSAAEMAMTDQNVRDVAEYLHTLGETDEDVPEAPALVDTSGPEWVSLGEEDFLNVNCYTDTWKWDGGHVYCTGRPTGVIRYREPLTDFEFVCEWMHKKKGGNSGVFVWASNPSLINCAAGRARLPHGIEVQVLDLGYKEVYEKQFGKPGDWFTSHGDVFTVGPVKMNPFPPIGPQGRRSFPSQETTRGIFQWNHYHVKAVKGEVRLWVNGVEVSGGDQIEPASGYLCLESEGAPIEFRNLKLKKLSPLSPDFEVVDIPVPVLDGPPPPAPPQPKVTLEGHNILGTWTYLKTYTREFTADGVCILRNGEEVIWKRGVTKKAADRVVLEGNLGHLLHSDGTLRIEGRYNAKRKE